MRKRGHPRRSPHAFKRGQEARRPSSTHATPLATRELLQRNPDRSRPTNEHTATLTYDMATSRHDFNDFHYRKAPDSELPNLTPCCKVRDRRLPKTRNPRRLQTLPLPARNFFLQPSHFSLTALQQQRSV
jgi:hypothetical protein